MSDLLVNAYRYTNTLVIAPLACLVLYLAVKKIRSKGPLPPGPRGLPFIGNALDMPKDYEWEHWAKHKEIYGRLKPSE
jgi:hypothetical protein